MRPMRHRIAGPASEGRRREVRYSWRAAGKWATLGLECEGKPGRPAEGSLEQFITEHYWGYTRQRDKAIIEYRVEREPWRLCGRRRWSSRAIAGHSTGRRWLNASRASPISAVLAEGSSVAVWQGMRINAPVTA
jgi:uncharacterized protein